MKYRVFLLVAIGYQRDKVFQLLKVRGTLKVHLLRVENAVILVLFKDQVAQGERLCQGLQRPFDPIYS
jgi:hypothetical protein